MDTPRLLEDPLTMEEQAYEHRREIWWLWGRNRLYREKLESIRVEYFRPKNRKSCLTY